jgi:hypothetical protein
VAAINDRMNIQSPWGSGLIVNTHILQNNGKKFVDYYKENVKNIGDVLYEVTSMFSGTMSKMNEDEFNALYNYKPILNESNIKVSHINKHLNDSVTVKNIRALYSQKKKYNTELDEIQKKITITNSKLAEISFDDTNNMRAVYTAELTEYNKKKNELVTSITKIMDEISLSANNSEVPIEDAKYRIRGYYKLSDNEDHIIGINVQYRYKNIDTPQTNAESFNGEFIYSDWNVMDSIYRKKLTKYDGQLIYKLEDDNSNKNEPSFNQIDIPISQGETVDIRLKVIYDYGYPFVEVSSQWSDIVNIKFPDEYLKDVQILDIIKENNNDIETNRFQNMLRDAGIPEHIGDKIIDQDITYFHKPENIASGFYTAERRIIPLKDKLSEINSHIIALRDEVLGTSSSQIDINIINGDIASKLYPYQNNKIFVESYNTINNTNDDNSLKDNGIYAINNGIVSTVLNISISNTSQRSVKIFSLFPGSRGTSINVVKNYKFDKKDYCDNNGGVYLKYHTGTKLQGCNQLLTFRIKDAYNGVEYYSNDQDWYMKDNVLYLNDWKSLNDLDGIKFGANMYPMIKEEYALVIDDSNAQPYMILSPGEEIIVPVIFEYVLKDDNNSISKTMSFDIRTSLYNDPINYTFQVIANKENTTQDKLINTNKKYINAAKYHTTVIK